KASLFAAPTLMTTLLDAPVDVSPLRVATSVYVPAAAVPVIWQFAKLATPATAATVVAVHPSEPPAGPELIPSVTFPLSDVTVLPYASCTFTTGCVASATPSATPPTGCVENASLLTAPTAITTLLDAPVDVRPERVPTSVYVPAAAVPVIWQPVKV